MPNVRRLSDGLPTSPLSPACSPPDPNGHFGGKLIRTQSTVNRALAQASNPVERTMALVMTLV